MNAAGLGAVAGGYQDAQDKALQRQVLQQRLAIQQQAADQQQREIERQQQSDAALLASYSGGGALPGAQPVSALPPPPPTGQQPMPGQPSVPMQQPGQPPMAAGGSPGPLPGAQPMPAGPSAPSPPGAPPGPPQGPQAGQPQPQGDPNDPMVQFKHIGAQMAQDIFQSVPAAKSNPTLFAMLMNQKLEMLKQLQPVFKDQAEAVQNHIRNTLDQSKFDEQKRHTGVEEGQGAQRLGMEGARLGMDKQRLQLEQQGKPQILTDPAHKDADGNDIPATQFVYDAATKKATTLDGEPYHPVGAQKLGGAAGAGGGGFGGGLKARYDQNMVRSGNEINRTLQMLDNVGSGVSGGVFSGSKKQGVGSWLGGKMTDEDQTDFNSAFAGADQEMGNMIRNGLGVSDAAAHEMIEGFKPVASDTNYNRVFKLANMAAKAKTAIQSTFPTDPEAKASKDQLIHTLDQYPTPEEVRAARKAGGDIDAQTFGDAMRQIKHMGGGKAPGTAPTIVGPNGEKMTLSPDGKAWVPVQ